jgi:hypothetical protein
MKTLFKFLIDKKKKDVALFDVGAPASAAGKRAWLKEEGEGLKEAAAAGEEEEDQESLLMADRLSQRRNTSSTLFVDSTLSSPDKEATIT